MSKSYKLKRIYTLFKLLAGILIGFTFLYKLVEVSYTGMGDNADLFLIVVCGVSLIHHILSYMKVNMEKDDYMEQLIAVVKANERRSKINRKLIARTNKRQQK